MNLIQRYRYSRFVRRDLWREARIKSQPGLIARLLMWVVGLFRPKAKSFMGDMMILRNERAFVVDLSSYQPNCNVEALIDAGVTHFFLRMVYIGVYMMDQWALQEDTTYKMYYDRIRAYAKQKGVTVRIGGYILYTAGVELQDYANSHIYTDLVGQVMGQAYKPDALWIDDEVDHWWEHGQTVYAGAVNQVRGCLELRRKLWERFKIVVGHYSGRWFINKYKSEYETKFDQLNKPGGLEKPMPIWTAWYPVTLKELFTDVWAVLDRLPTPTSQQKIDLLDEPGSYSQCDCWQFSGSWLTPFNKNALGQNAGLDASISWNSRKDFDYAMGLTDSTPPPPVEEDPAGVGAIP